jgi:hypothetical protein
LAAIFVGGAMLLEDARGVRADDRHGPRHRRRVACPPGTARAAEDAPIKGEKMVVSFYTISLHNKIGQGHKPRQQAHGRQGDEYVGAGGRFWAAHRTGTQNQIVNTSFLARIIVPAVTEV